MKPDNSLWLGCDSGHCLSIVSLTASAIYRYYSEKLQNLQALVWLIQWVIYPHCLSVIESEASWLLVAAYCLVFIGLGLKFGWRNGF